MLPILATKAAVSLALAGWLAVSGAQVYEAGKGRQVLEYVTREGVRAGVKKIRQWDGLEKPAKRNPQPPKTMRDHLADLFGKWVHWMDGGERYDYQRQQWVPADDPAIIAHDREEKAWWKGLSEPHKRQYADFIKQQSETTEEVLAQLEQMYR